MKPLIRTVSVTVGALGATLILIAPALAEHLAEPTTSAHGARTVLRGTVVTPGADRFAPQGGQPTNSFPAGDPGVEDAVAFTETLQQGDAGVGNIEGRCTRIEGGVDRCDTTVTFRRGTIHSVGNAGAGGVFTLPLVAGTGAYAGITGTVTVDPDETTGGLTYRYTLPGPGGGQVSTVPVGGAATGGGGTPQSTDTGLLIGVGVAAIAGSAGLFGAARFTDRHA